ncbi:MAG: DUF6320 domain-containing protein [Oscillospiraceae bacterium]|nr:DUF6320 domain-containing protein [Oscillospiraceae bacterium]
MSFCIKCGVELSESEPKCPLCSTVVYHPDVPQQNGKTLYPPYNKNNEETISQSGILFVLSIICLIPLVLTLMIDLSVNDSITWAGYAVGAILIVYTAAILPIWFRNPNPVIFSAADFAVVALYLFYIDLVTHGGWFLSFAFPVVGGIALIVITQIALIRYVKRGYLFIFGGAIIASGLFGVLIELLINYTFHLRDKLVWSIYPLVALFLIGMGLIVIAIHKPWKESLHRKFFI